MHLSDLLIIAVGVLAASVTWLLWIRVTRKVWTDEHPVTRVRRANDDPARIAYPG